MGLEATLAPIIPKAGMAPISPVHRSSSSEMEEQWRFMGDPPTEEKTPKTNEGPQPDLYGQEWPGAWAGHYLL